MALHWPEPILALEQTNDLRSLSPNSGRAVGRWGGGMQLSTGTTVQGRMKRKARAKEPSKGRMPRFVPTDDERALVKLLTANGYAQHLVRLCISNRRGPHTRESAVKRAFTHELKARLVELCTSWQRTMRSIAAFSAPV